jgi:hypothetical protein
MISTTRKFSLNSKDYFLLFCVVFIFKFILFCYIFFYGNDFFGGGDDSNYYHSYAIGLTDVAANAWPVILRWLNDIGVYSREIIILCIAVVGLVFIPLMVADLVKVRGSTTKGKSFWACALIVALYPTLFYYTTDIYREICMVFIFLVGLKVLKILSEKRRFPAYCLFLILGFLTFIILYAFRPYLGFGCAVALLFAPFYRLSWNNQSLIFSFYFVFLFLMYVFGVLDPVLQYRGLFSDILSGGTNLGIKFSSPENFFQDLIKSSAFQIFGLYFVGFKSTLVFFLESLPFVFFFCYILYNKKHSNKFVDYLVVFFVAYSTVWLLGNDNLGTAVRLRIFNYIVVYIAFFIVYQNKSAAAR